MFATSSHVTPTGRRTLAAALLGLALATLAAAQPDAGLRARLERGYEILPLEEGGDLALIPRGDSGGIRSIRIVGEEVRINGAQVPEPALRVWLGDDAEPILELLRRAPEERRRLFAAVESPIATAEAGSEPAPVEPPPARRRVSSDARVSVGSPVTVAADEVAEEVVVIGAPLRIEGKVEGDALAIGGSVEVSGQVGGDLGAIGSNVALAETAEVSGDVLSVGGIVERAPGAQVGGRISGISIGSRGLNLGDWLHFDLKRWQPGWNPWFFNPAHKTLNSAGGIVFLCVVASLLLLLARGTVERASQVIAAEPWKAGFIGLLSLVLASFVALILLISIIGWPVLAVMTLAGIAAAFLGYTAVAYRLGGWAERHFNLKLGSVYLAAALGVLLLQLCSLAADALGFVGWPLFLLVLLLGLFGFLVQFAAWMVGFGGVILSRFRPAPVLASAPPPVPPAPAADDPGDQPR